jgi:hypothetical protein
MEASARHTPIITRRYPNAGSGSFPTPAHNGRIMAEWFPDLDSESFSVFLTGPNQNDYYGQEESTNVEYLSAGPAEVNSPTFSSSSSQTGVSSPYLSLSPLSHILRELSFSSPVPSVDRLLPHSSPEMDQFQHISRRRESLLQPSPTLPLNTPVFSSPPLSPLMFAVSSDEFDSPGNNLLLFPEGDDGLTDLTTPSDPTIDVGSLFGHNFGHSPFRPPSVITTSSEGFSGSCYSDRSPHLVYLSSPNTSLCDSSTSLPTSGRVHGDVESTAKNSDRASTAHYLSSDSTIDAFTPTSLIRETSDSPFLAAADEIPDWLTNFEWLLNHEHEPEPYSPVPLTTQSDIQPGPDAGNPVISEKQIASSAHQVASAKRRTKIPKYSCSMCTQKLTSRDNLRSEPIASFWGRFC